MSWWKVAAGIVIVAFVLRETFQDLFHPIRRGAFSDRLGHTLFRLLRRWPPLLASAGPATIVVVIFSWGLLLVTGFAFIYWSVFPADFSLKTVNEPSGYDNFWWCFYYSLEMLTTLGLGDIQPVPNWLRILSSMHTLIGFSLVTASVTWIVVLFPALRRSRKLARKAHTLRDAELETDVPVTSAQMHVVLAGLADEVIEARVDLVHFPLLLHFHTADRRASIASTMFPLMHFATEGQEPGRDELVRLAAKALDIAVSDFAEIIGERLGMQEHSRDQILCALAELHLSGDAGQR